jgi:hypothetical protein
MRKWVPVPGAVCSVYGCTKRRQIKKALSLSLSVCAALSAAWIESSFRVRCILYGKLL